MARGKGIHDWNLNKFGNLNNKYTELKWSYISCICVCVTASSIYLNIIIQRYIYIIAWYYVFLEIL